jgi:maleylacetoacetate isomerase
MLELYDYFRSSASYRVRIVLNYKQIEYNKKQIHLVNNGGEQHSAEYKKINPQGLVPSLVDLNNNINLIQSLAIIEYLEEQYPNPSILPNDLILKTEARALAYLIACDVHPLNNRRVLEYLKANFKISEQENTAWYHHWLSLGLSSFEQLIKKYKNSGDYCLGADFSLADVCLVPQVYNAIRFELPNLEVSYPRIMTVYNNCLKLPCIVQAVPD